MRKSRDTEEQIAVARKLLIALWRYAKTGILPEGAQRKDLPV
jgi:hypothetical protein